MVNFKDLTGQKFGKLRVVSRSGSNSQGNTTWNCECECGNKTIVVGSKLINGHTKSCSQICYAGTDLIGQKFGRLLVIKQGDRKGKSAYWLCKCDCGKNKEIRTDDLRTGNTTSCGCLTTLPEGESAKKWLYNHIKYDAIKRGYFFELTFLDFGILTKQNCYYCGIEPYIKTDRTKTNRSNGEYIYNGIDRKDNKKGYILDNCVPCCKICNRMKSDMTYEEFINHIKKIFNYQTSSQSY